MADLRLQRRMEQLDGARHLLAAQAEHGDAPSQLLVLRDQFRERDREAAFEFEQDAEGGVDFATLDGADVRSGTKRENGI